MIHGDDGNKLAGNEPKNRYGELQEANKVASRPEEKERYLPEYNERKRRATRKRAALALKARREDCQRSAAHDPLTEDEVSESDGEESHDG